MDEEKREIIECENEPTSSYKEIPVDQDCDMEVMTLANYGVPNNPANIKVLIDVMNNNASITEWCMRKIKLQEERINELEQSKN